MLRRKALSALAAAGSILALSASPAMAIVGGNDASPGEYPSVAEITFGAFGCTGTLISPDTVLSAGHCGSLTGGAGLGSPAAWPAPADHRAGSAATTRGTASRCRSAASAISPNYLISDGNDVVDPQALAQLRQGADQGRRRGRARALDGGHRGDDRRLGRDNRGRQRPRHPAGGPGADHHRRLLRRRLQQLRRRDDGVRGLPAGRRRHLPGRLRRALVRPAAAWWAPRASARAAPARASRASTPGWRTPRLREWIRTQDPDGVN